MQPLALRAALAALGFAALTGCAAAPDTIQASYVSQSKYSGWNCEALKREYWTMAPMLESHEKAQSRRRTYDTWGAVLVGLTPTLFSPDNDREYQISMLKGELQAIKAEAQAMDCPLADPRPMAVSTAEPEPPRFPMNR